MYGDNKVGGSGGGGGALMQNVRYIKKTRNSRRLYCIRRIALGMSCDRSQSAV
jgi:hypothetical protein